MGKCSGHKEFSHRKRRTLQWHSHWYWPGTSIIGIKSGLLLNLVTSVQLGFSGDLECCGDISCRRADSSSCRGTRTGKCGTSYNFQLLLNIRPCRCKTGNQNRLFLWRPCRSRLGISERRSEPSPLRGLY